MLNVFLALAAIAGIGAALHRLLPGLDIDSTRRQCGTLVLNVLLPALNVEVIYRASVEKVLWQVPLAMLFGLLVCVASALTLFKAFALTPKQQGSLVIGSAFGNVTYLGMPLLRGLFPEHLLHVTEIAILCELTVTSSDLIAGSLLAMFYENGGHASIKTALAQIVRFPLLWSAAAAIVIRILGVPLPAFLLTALHLLGESASGLMLLILGMALKPTVLRRSFDDFRNWWPLLLINLGLSPIVVAFIAAAIGLSHLNFHATTLEAAMPPQLFTFIVADRFGFDTELLATVVAFTTVASLVTVPIINRVLT
jgi:malate permease and related proteins